MSSKATSAADTRAPQAIAIDGPVASGKSAVGSILAERLGYRFLDTGSMYRALTWHLLENGADIENDESVGRAAAETSMELKPVPGDLQSAVFVDGRDATPFLIRPDVERAVSQVSKVPAVRKAMVALQRRLAAGGRVVMAGRDIGTVVLPNAGLKVYLNASARERAKRRHQQIAFAGGESDVRSIAANLARRDAIDSGRRASPLRPADDAVIINTDGLTLEQVVARVMALLK